MSSANERPAGSTSGQKAKGSRAAARKPAVGSTRDQDPSEPDAATPLLHRSVLGPPSDRATRRTSRVCRIVIPFLLIAAFLSVFRHAWPWSTSPPSPSKIPTSLLPNSTISNGTHTFHRTVILISLDGAKPSYLTPTLAPHLTALGTSSPRSRLASHMQPIFPTLTFPNHWTLLTGLYASSHGIVANDFTDSSGNQFYYTSPAHSWSSDWWRGEPIWATAQRNGLNSAVLMWPGPPETQAGVKASYFQKYESDWKLDDRLGKVLEWIDVDDVRIRPSCVCVYVPDIDQASHRFGPESEQALDAVRRVDGFIGNLTKEVVEKRSLGQIVDIVVVSDHGMTSTSNDKLIYLDELLGSDLYAQLQGRDGWPSAGLRFRGTPSQREKLEHLAFQRLSSLPPKSRKGWNVFERSTLPPRYHLSDDGRVDDRLAPIWIVPDLGWSITDHAEMATFADGTYAPRGNHGYDNQEDDMQAIFVASGPSFRGLEKAKGKGRRWNMKGFANVQVHNLVSRILGVREAARAQTNGTWEFWDQHLRDGL